MKIRKYVARNMPEALQQVRDDLGPNAVILNTRQLRRNNRFNLADEPRVEVTAACDEAGGGLPEGVESAPEPPRAWPAAPAPAPQDGPPAASLAALRYGLAASPAWAKGPVTAPPAPAEGGAASGSAPPQGSPAAGAAPRPEAAPAGDGPATALVARQLQALQEAVSRLERRSRPAVVLPEALARLGDRLQSVGVAPDLVHWVLQQALEELGGRWLEDHTRVAERVAQLLARRMPPCRDIRLGRQRRVVAFCGAAGSGKTTAAAKIAAGFAMKRADHIVLVSADDRRVGALDQARAFARIIGVPLEVAYTEEEMAAVLARHGDARLVLVDAAGCGPQDEAGRGRQQRLFAAAGVAQVHVVIDGKGSLEHMLDQIEASAGLPERRLLFTKMDEVARAGAVLSAAAASGVPASYLTVGPAVPGQIEAGNLARLATRVLGVSAASPQEGR
ncbi:MAG: flagellar biosynthesis protein FlhF [Candidatus Latescibacterota bacterium]